MNHHLEQSKAATDEPDQGIDNLVLEGVDSLTGTQPSLVASTDMSAFEGQNPVGIEGKEKPGQDNNGQSVPKPLDKDPLPDYLKAVKTTASLPDKTGEKLHSAVGTYIDAINKSPANAYHSGNHQQVVDRLKEVVSIAENLYGDKDPRLLPILQKVASVCVTDPQLPSTVKSKYAVGVLEKILSMQKDTGERGKTLSSLSREYYTSNDKKAALGTLDKILKEAETNYGKDDQRMIPVLSHVAFSYYRMSNYPESIKFLEKARELQSSPDSKESPEKRIDTLLRLTELYRYGSGTANKAVGRLEEANTLAEKSYPRNDPRYQSFLEDAARRSKYSNLHAQSASFFERIYDLQTGQNQSVEKRLETLQKISTAYFEGRDYEKGAKAYQKVIEFAKTEFAKDDKALSSALELSGSMHSYARGPYWGVEKNKDNLAEETKSTNGLYDFGNVLIEAGNVLAAHGKHNLALENYKAALESFKQCLTRGIDLNSDKLATMLSISDLEIKYEPISKDEIKEQVRDRENQFMVRDYYKRDLEHFFRDASKLVSKETNNQNPHLLDALDKISAFYKRPDRFDSNRYKEALPVLTQALALSKKLNKTREEIGERTVELSVAQIAAGDKAAAIKTCTDLFEEAKKASGGKSKTVMLALRYLSQHSLDGYWKADENSRKGYFEEALRFKEREVKMAKVLKRPDVETAKIIDEQAQLELSLEDKESALANMERALKLDNNLVQVRQFTERIAKIYGENGQLDQMQEVLHMSIAALKKNADSDRPVSSLVEFAQLATKQDKPEKMKDAAQMLEEVNRTIEAREQKGAFSEVLSVLNQQAVSTLAWLAPYYEDHQNDLVKAEQTYLNYERRALMGNGDESRSHRMAALAGLVRIYTARGRKAEAKERQAKIDFLNGLK